MPTYDFGCPAGHEFERFYRKMSEAPLEVPCPVCGKPAVRRVSGGAGLIFKGSGFYITDYGKDGKKAQRQEKAGEGKGAEGKGAEAKGGESKGGDTKGSEGTGERAPAAESKSGESKSTEGATSKSTEGATSKESSKKNKESGSKE